MANLHTLNEINAGVALVSGNKLGSIPSNRYPPSRTELENQLACANQDREIAIECGNRLANKCSVLDKDNKRIQRDLNRSNKDKEKLSKHIYQLINEVKRLHSELDTLTSQITRKDISLNEYKDKIRTKLKEMKALQSKIKASETRLSSTQKDSSMKESEIDYLRVELSALNSNLASKNSELERMKNMLTLKNGELELIKNDLAEKNSEIRSLETRLKELLPCNRLSSEQVKIRGKTDEKNDDNISVMQSPPKDLDSLSLAKYFVRKPRPEGSLLRNKRENSQVDRDIQESLTQQTLTSLNDNMPKESEISNEKQINNEQIRSNISPKISPESSSHIISKIKNNNIPIREIEALPVVTLGAGEALVNYKYQIPSIIKLVVLVIITILIIWYIYRNIFHPTKKEENFYPVYRKQSYGFPFRHAEKLKDRITSNETFPYGYR